MAHCKEMVRSAEGLILAAAHLIRKRLSFGGSVLGVWSTPSAHHVVVRPSCSEALSARIKLKILPVRSSFLRQGVGSGTVSEQHTRARERAGQRAARGRGGESSTSQRVWLRHLPLRTISCLIHVKGRKFPKNIFDIQIRHASELSLKLQSSSL